MLVEHVPLTKQEQFVALVAEAMLEAAFERGWLLEPQILVELIEWMMQHPGYEEDVDDELFRKTWGANSQYLLEQIVEVGRCL